MFMSAPDCDSIFSFICEELHLTGQEHPIQPINVNSELHPMDLKIFNYLIGFKPGWSRQIFKGEKILSTPSFGGEVKRSVPCRRFAACKRSLELRGSRILDEICRNISRPWRITPSAARGLSRCWTWRHLVEEVGTSKGGGKQWQPIPKNLPRMQCARAIPVAWLGSGSC